MRAARRQIGAILLESGRITPEDVERVLEYQRQHGGFFGQGLVTLGIVSRDELDWALANQLDLPYIFPNAAAVDRDAAALVAPDWALAHLAVPIVRSGDALTIVAAEPLAEPVIEQLRATTGLDIEMALASAIRIRELIHDIYGDPDQATPVQPVSLAELLAAVVDAAADVFGISARRTFAIGWIRADEPERFRLHEGWAAHLDETLVPRPAERIPAGGRGAFEWDAHFRVAAREVAVRVRALVGEGGVDYRFALAQPMEPRTNVRGLVLPDAIAAELRMLSRSGPARIAVIADNDEFTRAIVPRLPRMFAQRDVRSVHLSDATSTTAFTLRIEDDPSFPDVLHTFDFDVVTLDTERYGPVIDRLMSIAPLCLAAVPNAQRARLAGLGFSWVLNVSIAPDGVPVWELLPVGR